MWLVFVDVARAEEMNRRAGFQPANKADTGRLEACPTPRHHVAWIKSANARSAPLLFHARHHFSNLRRCCGKRSS